jgi:deoxyribonuclease-2
MLLLLLLLLPNTSYALDCISDQGKPVDSWLLIKTPQGTTYFYYDSYNKIFDISPYSLNDTSRGALAYTTKQLWQSDANYVLYNDQSPKGNMDLNSTTAFGHTKGFFAFDEKGNGFWLTHSIPLFPLGPSKTSEYLALGRNAGIYAQHLLCLSVNAKTLNDLASKFLLNKPNIYDVVIKTTNYHNINQLVSGKYSTEKLCESSPFFTQSGMEFIVYSKTAQWNNELWAECVTPQQKDTLLVESWIRGSAEGPICPSTDYDTLDIKYLDFLSNKYSYSWPETKDHSKWAITLNKPIVCMGDINRMTTQYSRGGGTACFSDMTLHSILKKAITTTDTCQTF